MDTNFSKRFSDYKLIDKIIEETEDFKQRTFKVKGIKVIYHLLIIMCISILFVWGLIGVVQADITKIKLDNLIMVSTVILSLFVLLIFLTSTLLISVYKAIMTSEFQSLLFSSGILVDNKGFMILAQDKKSIIYMDMSSRSLFKNTSKNSVIETLIDDIKMNEDQKKLLIQALSDNQKFIYNVEANEHKLTFYFFPLPRPKNFFIIKLNVESLAEAE